MSVFLELAERSRKDVQEMRQWLEENQDAPGAVRFAVGMDIVRSNRMVEDYEEAHKRSENGGEA